jgi:hypothetical protein
LNAGPNAGVFFNCDIPHNKNKLCRRTENIQNNSTTIVQL